MASVTHAEFGANTEGVEVAKAFADGVRGKTILVTGGNKNGLGFSAAHALASQSPKQIIITGRNVNRVQECIDAIKKDFPDIDYRILQVDLSSQESVRKAGEEVLSWQDVPKIDIVINSAGVMGIQERTLSKDGIELTFATNHIGHWLLSCLIMPKLIKAAETNPKGATRIVNVTSGSPFISGMRWSDMTFDKKNKDLPEVEQPVYKFFETWGYKDSDQVAYIPLDSYNRSKVANVLFGIGANKRLFDKYGILTLAVHPGVITTDLGRNFPEETLDAVKEMSKNGTFTYKSLGAGSSTAMVAALDPKLAVGVGETHNDSENWGSFMADCQITGKAKPQAVSSQEAEKLWDVSEKLVGQNFSW
ncbi:retinol dehydrogenase protein [Pochonia chlamydosporia 170]|uniref:Retinol dehydrogenase protein n=1 Tax=Pochonia chlamydosporia 170 TaxID=1380566 RepID=A0A179F5G2_METCM|nr:retinol dehydrogenase protein [Pochonia chlamydosporia 170]OAQ60665.1 retinol dehydrogenase protein [Pochonia chlamydosporia 170]